MEDNIRFGIFMAPFHPPAGQDPISAVQRDLEIVQLLDRLGYEEASQFVAAVKAARHGSRKSHRKCSKAAALRDTPWKCRIKHSAHVREAVRNRCC